MTRENLKNQVNSKIVNDELSEEEMMHDIMQMVDAHVTQQLILSGVSQQSELLAFKDWFNKLPEDSDDRLYLTNETISRFKANCG
jgi:hypothetical protein